MDFEETVQDVEFATRRAKLVRELQQLRQSVIKAGESDRPMMRQQIALLEAEIANLDQQKIEASD